MAPGDSVGIMEPIHQELFCRCELFGFGQYAANISLARKAWSLHPVCAQLIGLPLLFTSHRGSPQGDCRGRKEVEEEIGKQ